MQNNLKIQNGLIINILRKIKEFLETLTKF